MKLRFLSILPLIFACQAHALAPGDAVTTDAITEAEFLQGSAPTSWQEGHVYLLECWATWCGPCIAAIPHVDALYDKYREKGFHVIGMNVWEDDKEKVANFVKGKGDDMSYPIAYVGKGGAFEQSWLVAGGVKGIPHAFIVMDGKLLFTAHPASLTEETIEALLAGGDEAKAITDEIRNQGKMDAGLSSKIGEFVEAQEAGDAEKMNLALAEIEKVDPAFPHLGRMKIEIALTAKDWDAAVAGLKSIDNPQTALMVAAISAQRFDAADPAPPAAFLEAIASVIAESAGENPTLHASLARIQWQLGKKDEALATAKSAAENSGQLPKEPFTEFAASFEKGEPQTLEALITALRSAMGASQGE